MNRKPSLWAMMRGLRASGILSASALCCLLRSVMATGVNLATLADVSARRFGDKAALVDAAGELSFRQLALDAERIAAFLRDSHGIAAGSRVGILCRDGISFARSMFAGARLGADLYALNPDLGATQLRAIIARHDLALVIAGRDTDLAAAMEGRPFVVAEDLLSEAPTAFTRLGRCRGGRLVVLTGGTTGPPKAAARMPRPGSYIRLFLDLIATLRLDRREKLFAAVPLCHGYGLASLIVGLALGRTTYVMARFRSDEACRMIAQKGIDALTVVPTMLQRMLAEPDANLASLRLIMTGGAALPPPIVERTSARLGQILFNLYGSSEAGLISIATPDDLAAAPATVGRPLWGVRIALLGDDDRRVGAGETGRVVISGAAAIRQGFLDTGDIGFRNRDGRLFIRGRGDEMISSGGEKVHPWEVESEMLRHPCVLQAAAIGVDDADFGKRLIAFVAVERSGLTPEMLSNWLAGRLARFQQPRRMHVLDALPVTAAGKLDKAALYTLVD